MNGIDTLSKSSSSGKNHIEPTKEQTIQYLLETFPELTKANETPLPTRISPEQREKYLQESRHHQQQRYDIAVANGLVKQSTHLFDHTKRDGHKFDTHKVSMRYQMMFAPDDVQYILPTDSSQEAEKICIQASIIDREKVDPALLKAYLTYMYIPLPRQRGHHSDLIDTLTHSVHHSEFFKGYLAQGKVLDYFDHETTKTTPRVIRLPDGVVLVIAKNNQVSSEKHLRTYEQTDFFCKIYKDVSAYHQAEKQVIQKLAEKGISYRPLHDWMSQEYRLPDATNLLRAEIHTPRRQKTLDELIAFYQYKHSGTDKKIVLLLEKIKTSSHIGHITTRKENISILLGKDTYERGEKQKTLTQQLDTGDI